MRVSSFIKTSKTRFLSEIVASFHFIKKKQCLLFCFETKKTCLFDFQVEKKKKIKHQVYLDGCSVVMIFM